MNCSCLKCGHLVRWTPSLLCKECQREDDYYAEEAYYSWEQEVGEGWAIIPQTSLDNDEFSE